MEDKIYTFLCVNTTGCRRPKRGRGHIHGMNRMTMVSVGVSGYGCLFVPNLSPTALTLQHSLTSTAAGNMAAVAGLSSAGSSFITG